MATLLSNVLNAIRSKDPSSLDSIVDSVEAKNYEDLGNEVGTGLQNWWYKNTGRAHLTPEYQHEEMLANTAMQRAAADYNAAGLSKYGGISGASSPSPSGGNGLLATALQAQQLASGALDLKERRYNYNVSRGLGIRTSDKNALAPIAVLLKFFTGKDLSDFGNEPGGAIRALIDWWKENFPEYHEGDGTFDSPSGDMSTPVAAAAVDAVQGMLKQVPETGKYVYGSGDQPLIYRPVAIGSPEDAKSVMESAKSLKYNVDDIVSSMDFGHVDYHKALNTLLSSALDSGYFSSSMVFGIASNLSKRYHISVNQVLDDLMDEWDKIHGSEGDYLNFVDLSKH